ncbi:NAD(P)/FAD-dependent oxidoreductase [Arthrobacter sp. H41]|uniref:NAD(P)/FAD-dependent oxidoreductase n=1 Tax=Arthrobacter sp. H41 TaxID=1312978 RepID=UPI00047CF524|nr:FAD-dependent oxidoreductase [Arthrobacter sp. H41]
MQTLAVVGASLAGLSAARAARAQGFDGDLVLIGDEPERPYDRPPLSKDFLLGHQSAQDLLLEDADENLDAQWLLGVGAKSLDAASKTITLDDGRTVTADSVVIATGASARRCPEFAGIGNAFTLRTLADARNLAPHLAKGKRLVVIGAGFIGSEVASAATTLGMHVTVVGSDPVPFHRQFGVSLGSVVAGLHQRNGVELISGTRVKEVHSSAGWATGVTLDNGRYLPADVVLVGVGAQPNTGWLAGSGIDTGGGVLGDGVLCDEAGRTSAPGIVAVGDCAAWFDPATGRHRRLEHWTGALERPAPAVAALLGSGGTVAAAKPPYFWSDQYGTTIQFAGNAETSDRVEVAAGDLLSLNFLAVYYRGEDPVAVLGLDQARLFTKWRRALKRPVAAALGALAATGATGVQDASARSSYLVS